MTKQELLRVLHALAWLGDDRMDQETLEKLQSVIGDEINAEVAAGGMTVKKLANGFNRKIDGKVWNKWGPRGFKNCS